ncbi:MAG TPA: hypothetical protein PKD64_12070 [Pirellulaceae bacterium]|nr:hypothetical protein [Pirellulaceae bacterium]HMO92922.1 hypothetical protein [Pirellulaceae bacterium]HMP71057.1 hypothetical protein [Pirellulaceae bacterium]
MKREFLMILGATLLAVISITPVHADLIISSASQTSQTHVELATNPGEFVSSSGPTVTDTTMPLSTSSSVSAGPAPFTGGFAQAITSGAAPAPTLNTNGLLELSVSGFAQAVSQYGQQQTELGLITTTALSDALTSGGYAFELTEPTIGNVTAFINAPNLFTHVTLTGPNGFSIAPTPGSFYSESGITFPQGNYQLLYNAYARAIADSPNNPFVQVQAGYSFRVEFVVVPEPSGLFLVGLVSLGAIAYPSRIRKQID